MYMFGALEGFGSWDVIEFAEHFWLLRVVLGFGFGFRSDFDIAR